MKRIDRRLTALVALLLIAGVVWGGTVRDAEANQVHGYSVKAVNTFSATPLDGGRFSFTGRALLPPGPFGPPDLIWAYTSGWSYTQTVGPIWRTVVWTGGPSVPLGGIRYFTHGVRVPGSAAATATYCWGRWTLAGSPTGPPIPGLGWRFTVTGALAGSPPESSSPAVASALVPYLYNSATLPDGSPNTANMVVRNLQFAMSDRALLLLNFENPYIQELFANTLDAVRPGPLSVAPGDSLAINDLHVSITDPVGRQAVIAKGTVADDGGEQHEFLFQLSNVLPVPAGTPGSLVIASLMLGGLGIIVLRIRSRRMLA